MLIFWINVSKPNVMLNSAWEKLFTNTNK